MGGALLLTYFWQWVAPEILGGARFHEKADVYSTLSRWSRGSCGRCSHPHPNPNPNPNPNPSPNPNLNPNSNPSPNPNPHLHPHQVLTHSLPFTGMNPVQIGLAVREQKLRPELPADCPDGFGALLRDCWHDEPERRHTFAASMGRLQAIEAMGEFHGD